MEKQRLKDGQLEQVLHALWAAVEREDVQDKDAPIKRCHRYLSHRRGQLDYAGALRAELPIGSGEIESAHRYLVQKRLKLAGAWWRA
ncbi:MAG: ISKra4 family transposase, partial [Desulfobulbus sp.]|nr:ISKra4 family transposase [Desulfobulbus sp.]